MKSILSKCNRIIGRNIHANRIISRTREQDKHQKSTYIVFKLFMGTNATGKKISLNEISASRNTIFASCTFQINRQVSQRCTVNRTSAKSTFWSVIVMRWTQKEHPGTETVKYAQINNLMENCIKKETQFNTYKKTATDK